MGVERGITLQPAPGYLLHPVLPMGTRARRRSGPGGPQVSFTYLAAFTGAPPGDPEGGAALRPQSGPLQVHLTMAILDLQPAGAFCAVWVEEGGTRSHLQGSHLHLHRQRPRICCSSHLHTRCQGAPAGCQGRIRRRRSPPGSGTRRSHRGWRGTR